MTRSQKEWLGAALLALSAAGVIWIATLMPDDCKPDGYESLRQNYSLIIGGSMLIAGCPEPEGHR